MTLRNAFSYLMLASIFITGAGIELGLFKFYWYYPIYGAFLVYGLATTRRYDLRLVATFGLVMLYALITYRSGLSLVLKQIINLTFSFLVFYYFLRFEGNDIIGVFTKYVRVAKVIAVLGIIQVALFAMGAGWIMLNIFPWLKEYPVSTRLQSLTQEPSYIAFTLAPIVLVSVHNIFFQENRFFTRWWSWVFIVTYLMTQSAIAFASLFVIIVVIYLKNFSYLRLQLIILFLALLSWLGYMAYKNIEGIKFRIDDTITGLSGNFFAGNTYLRVNPSSYAILSNYYITLNGFRENPLLGNGLGTYSDVYDKHIPGEVYDVRRPYMLLNRQDGASMLFRLLVETGVVGVMLFLVFVWRFRLKSRSAFSERHQLLWLINAGIFVIILLALLRNGNYTVHGKILFFIMYYYSYRLVKLERSVESVLSYTSTKPSYE